MPFSFLPVMEDELALLMPNIGVRWERVIEILQQRPDLRAATLELPWCTSMIAVPESVFGFTHLTALRIVECFFLTAVSEGLGHLQALQVLELRGCFNLTGLPESLGQLGQLRTLNLAWCYRLRTLPESIGRLSALQELNLDHCLHLRRMPASLVNLSCTLTCMDRNDAGMTFPPAAVAAQGLPAVKHFMFGAHFSLIMLLLILAARRRRMRHPPAELWALVRDEFFLF